MKAKRPNTEQPKVRCADCRHFERDTTGISHNIETGVYFMGVCRKGHTPDSPVKQFADKEKFCDAYLRR